MDTITQEDTMSRFQRGDRVITRQGRTGTVASVAQFSGRVDVRLDDGYGATRDYDPNSLRKTEEVPDYEYEGHPRRGVEF